MNKVYNSFDELFEQIDIKDNMTLSFHHHLRNGDDVVNQVIAYLSDKGVKGLNLAISSIFPVHSPLVEHIESGMIKKLYANYMSGPVADAVSEGKLQEPAVMQTHGGRARSIHAGELKIDIAFIASPSADKAGNVSGLYGPSACGSLGYAIPDAMCAAKVVAVTDHLVPYPADHIEISEEYVDYCLCVPSIGDPKGIVSGTTQITKDPVGLKIAKQAVAVMEAGEMIEDGMSFQTGAGGTSLAVAHFLRQRMKEKNVKGSFASGGITGYLVDMFEEGLFSTLFDVQCFDLQAVESLKKNINHKTMSASLYGSPDSKSAVVDHLDVMILGATEIDTDFNVNVTTGSDGRIMGGSGGHSDTAEGSKLSIVVTQLVKGRMPIVKEKVTTVTTPGKNIDVLVTERGIAVNPLRKDLLEIFNKNGLKTETIESLRQKAIALTGQPKDIVREGKTVALVEYRDGRIIDEIKQV